MKQVIIDMREKDEFSAERVEGSIFPIMRQVQLVAGFLGLIAVALAWWLNKNWIFLSAFVSAGLLMAGATGFCGMAEILCRMPWNKSRAGGARTCSR